MQNKNDKPLTEPSCDYGEINEPNLELMARAFINSYFKSIRKEIRQQLKKESTENIS